MTTNVNPKWKLYAQWLDTPTSSRVPSSDSEWGAAHGIAARTLRRWKQDPLFIAMRAAVSVSEPVADVVVDDGSDEASYRAVKAQLVTGARGGNAKALELYFKTYGKPYVEEEVAARTLDLENLELPGLVVRALMVLAPEELEAELTSMGWSVSRPSVS